MYDGYNVCVNSLVAVAAIASSSKGPKEKRQVRATNEEGAGFTRPKASQSGAGAGAGAAADEQVSQQSDSSTKKAVPSITKKKGKKKLGQVKMKVEGGSKMKKPPQILQDELSRLGRHRLLLKLL